MNRRAFLHTALAGSIVAGYAGSVMAAERYFPTKVVQSLFEGSTGLRTPLLLHRWRKDTHRS